MNQKTQWQIKPRLGLINYINCLPVLLPIAKGLVDLDAQLILGEPSTLNSLFAASQLEYGAMSTYAFLEQNNQVELLPYLSISSQKAVTSVLFFSRKSVLQHSPQRICVPSGSATSINLMRLMLLQFNDCKPAITIVEEPSLGDNDFDAALVIGDLALAVDESWSKEYSRYDLGEWWANTYNLPMVFGVFVARSNWLFINERIIDSTLLMDQLGQGLKTAAGLGLGEYFHLVLEESEAKTNLSRKRLEQYYKRDLDFSWSAKHQESITKFELLCRLNGFLQDKKVLA